MALILEKSNTFETELMVQAIRKNMPIMAVFELTYKCNFRCIHCYVVKDRLKKELPFNKVCSIIDQLKEAGIFILHFTGGEIFTRNDIFDILTYAKRKNFITKLTTNCSLLSKEKIDRLKEIGLLRLNISVYGLNDLEYKKITRTAGMYNNVITSIKYLSKRKVPFSLRFPLLKESIGNYSKYEYFARSLGAEDYGFVINIHKKDDGSLEPLCHRITESEYDKYYAKLVKNVIKRPEQLLFNEGEGVGCGAGKSHFAITPYGEINACLKLRTDRFNLSKKSFTEWINSPEFNIFKKFNINIGNCKICLNCDIKNFCIPCIVELINYIENNGRKYPLTCCKHALIRKKIYEEILKKGG